MIGEILGYSALVISGLVTLFFLSRLSLSVFIFLMIWEVSDLILQGFNSYYIYPALFIGISLDYLFLKWLSFSAILCTVTPMVTAISALYASVCLATEYFGITILMDYYGLVMGLAALLAALEGASHGYRAKPRFIFNSDGTVHRSPWMPVSVHSNKEGM